MNEERRERLVTSIVEAALPELARRRQAAGPWAVLDQWTRELVAAAAIVAALAATALTQVGMSAVPGEEPVLTVADALVPEAVAEWLVSGDGPVVGDLIIEFVRDEESEP